MVGKQTFFRRWKCGQKQLLRVFLSELGAYGFEVVVEKRLDAQLQVTGMELLFGERLLRGDCVGNGELAAVLFRPRNDER